MTEPRYSDGTLAKWYYSQTDVISNGDNEYYLKSKKSIRNVDYSTLLGTNDLLDELNRISDENEQLKQFIDELTTKGTGRIDLENGYSYKVSAVLTNWKKGDV